jgi:hypothetical protein
LLNMSCAWNLLWKKKLLLVLGAWVEFRTSARMSGEDSCNNEQYMCNIWKE